LKMLQARTKQGRTLRKKGMTYQIVQVGQNLLYAFH
jgi:hypothetical protein